MKTLREFMQERKYVAVIYDDETQKRMREWAEDNGFDLTVSYSGKTRKPEDFDFHTTIFFSDNEVNLKNETSPIKGVARVTGMKMLGENEDIPVLTIASPDVTLIRKKYDQMGLRDSWPNYIPHVSVSYSKDLPDVKSVKLPDFPLTFDKITVKKIED